MNNFEIHNDTNIEIKSDFDINNFVIFVLEKLDVKNTFFEITFVDDEKIQLINKNYRNKDKVTDVISFAFEDDGGVNVPGVRFLGEIYISLDTARRQANDYGHKIERELAFLIVHGILHLLGYNHIEPNDEKIMFDLQERILNEYGITR